MEERLGNLLSSLPSQLPHNQGGATVPDVLAKRGALVPGSHRVGEASWKNINWKMHPRQPSPGLSPAEFAGCVKSMTHQLFMFLTLSSGASAI